LLCFQSLKPQTAVKVVVFYVLHLVLHVLVMRKFV
jgi:hypothetical protein